MGGSEPPPLPLSDSKDGVTFAVRVIPRAGRTAVAGVRGDALLVRLAAPPVEGAANEALVALVADLFDRPKRDVRIVSGAASRDKRVAIAGVPAAEAGRRLLAILADL
jgi:uncharacterized protein (TIGR00251 family)